MPLTGLCALVEVLSDPGSVLVWWGWCWRWWAAALAVVVAAAGNGWSVRIRSAQRRFRETTKSELHKLLSRGVERQVAVRELLSRIRREGTGGSSEGIEKPRRVTR